MEISRSIAQSYVNIANENPQNIKKLSQTERKALAIMAQFVHSESESPSITLKGVAPQTLVKLKRNLENPEPKGKSGRITRIFKGIANASGKRISSENLKEFIVPSETRERVVDEIIAVPTHTAKQQKETEDKLVVPIARRETHRYMNVADAQNRLKEINQELKRKHLDEFVRNGLKAQAKILQERIKILKQIEQSK